MPNNKSLVDELSRIPDTVDARIKAAVSEILSLAEKYRRSGYSFTFSGTDIDADVNRILVQLSDYILEDADSEAYALTSDEDRDDALAYVNSLYDYQENVDKYSSHLKLILEGWLAIGFANSVSKGNLMSSIFSYMDNPYISPLWQKAFKEGQKYAADIIRNKGYTWGPGVPTSPKKGMVLVVSDFISRAFHEGVRLGFARAGVVAYRVRRGSNYPCPVCDDVCAVIHPISDRVLPVHPRCVCYAVPIMADKAETAVSVNIANGSSRTSSYQRISLTDEQKAHRKELQREAIAKYKGQVVHNGVDVCITATGIKEFLNQPHEQYFEKNELVLNLAELLRTARYEGKISYHKDNDYFIASHLYAIEINHQKSYLIAREDVTGMITFHSISDNPNLSKK